MAELPAPPVLPDGGSRSTDVVCLGHALVDRLAETGTDAIVAAGIEPGAMTLVDGEVAGFIEHAHDSWQEVAGGSAANTAVGIASLGGSAAFAGSVGADAAGRRYVADLEGAGVRTVAPVAAGEPTGVCHVFVTADGDRSMATSLGAAGRLAPAAVEEVGIAGASVVYVEGYLLDAPSASDAVHRALELAKGAGTLVALSLSDPFVVDRHRETILELLGNGAIDIVFGNEDEAVALAGTDELSDAVGSLAKLGSRGLLGLITRGGSGSVAFAGDSRCEVPAAPVDAVVDTTGAGDLYAAGVLFGLTDGRDVARSAAIGSLAAAEVISHLGARPRVALGSLI